MKRSVTGLTLAPYVSKSRSGAGHILAMNVKFPRRYKLRMERKGVVDQDRPGTDSQRKKGFRFMSWREIAVVARDLVARWRRNSGPLPLAVQHSTDASNCNALVLFETVGEDLCHKFHIYLLKLNKIRISFTVQNELRQATKKYWHYLIHTFELIGFYNKSDTTSEKSPVTHTRKTFTVQHSSY